MTWEGLLLAVTGAVIALSGTLIADVRRDRRQRDRERHLDRRRHCLEFTLALAEAHGALRDVARQPADAPTRTDDASRAVSTLYPAREQLLVSGTSSLLVAGEKAFHRLIDIRDAVRNGATLDSSAYHDAYHAFADALWRFRSAIRVDIGQPALTPSALGHTDWTDRENCTVCSGR